MVTDGGMRLAIAAAFGDEHYPHGRTFADAPVHMVISANERSTTTATTSPTSWPPPGASR